MASKFGKVPFYPAEVLAILARNNTVNVFLKPEVYQGIPAAVKRIPVYLASISVPLFLPPSGLSRFRGAKYSSNLVTLPSVRWGLFIHGVSRLSFIAGALSFLPSRSPIPFISLALPSLAHVSLSLSPSISTLRLYRVSLFLFPSLFSCGTNYIPAILD